MFLPSTSDLKLFPDNTASRFRVQLPQSIDLREGTDQHWEMALTEITFSQRLRTFINERLIIRELKSIQQAPFPKYYTPPSGPHYTYDTHYFALWFTAGTYKFGLIHPPNVITLAPRTAYEMGFSDTADKEVSITSYSTATTIHAKGPPRVSTRPANWSISVSVQTGWVPAVAMETTISLPSSYYAHADNMQLAITEALKAVKADSQVKLTWDSSSDRFTWTLLNENNKHPSIIKAFTEQAEIETNPIKPFRGDPVDESPVPLPEGKTVTALYMTDDLALILGMPTSFTMAPTTIGVAPPDPDRGVANIYIYTNISRPVIVGNMLVPLLRTVALQREIKNTVLTYSFKRPYYLPVNTDMLTTLEILLCDDLGQPVPFFHGRTQIVLHFRLMPGSAATAAESLEL